MVLLVISVAFIGYGAYRGEAQTVLTKAINLCLECVGIG
ncbi:MAG: CD1871A family CXXC motif-containing protein [Catonella sp.]